MSQIFTRVALACLVLISLTGCGGGGNSGSQDVTPPLISDATLTAQPSQTLDLPSAGTSIPLVSHSGSMLVQVKVTDASGVNTTSHPPVAAVYNQDGTEFSAPKNMLPSPGQPNVWTSTAHVIAGQPGNLNGIKIVTVSATDTIGNQVTQPIGLYFYSNPH